EMTPDEVALSKSTPSARFDISAPAAQGADAPVPEASGRAKAFFENKISDQARPVVVFALEWCEFCWSVKKLFDRCGIPYVSVDLDSAAYQEGDFGGDIRRALNESTNCITIPQIFIGGEFVGGCTETFDEFREGQLQQRLARVGMQFDQSVEVDPYSMLPKWLQPR
ncbi:MAG: glutaredoxin domain-containing protein, partial [bacterium]